MLRSAYIAWTRRALPLLLLPLAMTAVVQVLSAGASWAEGPEPPLGIRSLFFAAGVACIAWGRATRQKETSVPPLSAKRLVSLSWRLVTVAVLPSAIGAVLALMTRSVLDYYALLTVTLIGFVLLYPRYDQWLAWAGPPDEGKG